MVKIVLLFWIQALIFKKIMPKNTEILQSVKIYTSTMKNESRDALKMKIPLPQELPYWSKKKRKRIRSVLLR
jgi:hypothetical protein